MPAISVILKGTSSRILHDGTSQGCRCWPSPHTIACRQLFVQSALAAILRNEFSPELPQHDFVQRIAGVGLKVISVKIG